MGLAWLVTWLASSGILWVPVAAFVTAYAAGSQGLSPFPYSLKGACRSLCFVIPWVRLIVRMHLLGSTSNYRVPSNVALFMYIPALFAWLIFGIGFTLSLSIAKVYQLTNLSERTLQYDDGFIRVMIAVAVVGFIATLAGLIHWAYFLISLIRASSYRTTAVMSIKGSTHETTTISESECEYHASDTVIRSRLNAEYIKFSKPWVIHFCWLAFGFCYLIAVALTSEW